MNDNNHHSENQDHIHCIGDKYHSALFEHSEQWADWVFPHNYQIKWLFVD